MGDLKHRNAVFLSAGVPDASKPHYLGEADIAAISAAVSALLFVSLGRKPLVWGGHPAITPMIWTYAEALEVDYASWVTLYQSDIFEDDFPRENARFANVVVTNKVENDQAKSLEVMRRRMLSDNSFDAAVFIGGMKGIFDEYNMFKQLAPKAALLPIMSTGGAAERLGLELSAADEFMNELDYVALFYDKLGIDPNEPRASRRPTQLQ